MLGYEPSEMPMTGATWLNLIHPDDKERAMAANLDCIENRCDRFSVEFRMKAKDGSWRWILGRGQALERGPNGRARRLIGTHSDITTRKTLELSLTRSNREMEQFAYVASHDLREPLRMVGSYVELLARRLGSKLDPECQEFIQFAREGTKRMDRLILDLLDYSRIGRTAKQPPQQVDLNEVASQAVSILGLAIEESQAVIDIQHLPAITGFRDDLVRLFQNLIGNSLKYRHAERTPRVRIEAAREDHGWLIRVRDNGIGIHPDYLERIFGIFQRLHGREEYEGTGIGLANCKKIVELHGGRIWAESSPGMGSTFLFTLPDK
jgi:PAS domain S-box-containing protein